MIRIVRQKPVAYLMKKGEVFQMSKCGMHHIKPFFKKIVVFSHLFIELLVLPFRIHSFAGHFTEYIRQIGFGHEFTHFRKYIMQFVRHFLRFEGKNETQHEGFQHPSEVGRFRQRFQPVSNNGIILCSLSIEAERKTNAGQGADMDFRLAVGGSVEQKGQFFHVKRHL